MENPAPATADGLLDQAAAVFSRLEWSQRQWAVAADGSPCEPFDAGVVSVDVLGAIALAARDHDGEVLPETIGQAVDALRGYLGEDELMAWNARPDGGRDRDNVVQKLRAAARRRRDGVHHVPVAPPHSIDNIDVVAPRPPSSPKKKRQFSDETKLQQRAGQIRGTISMLKAGKRPDPDKIAEQELRLGAVQQELHERFGHPLPEPNGDLERFVGSGRRATSASGL